MFGHWGEDGGAVEAVWGLARPAQCASAQSQVFTFTVITIIITVIPGFHIIVITLIITVITGFHLVKNATNITKPNFTGLL